MIQVQLQFATIAAAVAALARIDASAIVHGDAVPAATITTGVSAEEKATVLGKPEKAKAEPKAKATPAAATASTTPAQEPATTPAASADKVDYATLQKAVFKLVGLVKATGSDPAVEVLGIARELAANDSATFKELPAEQWPVALARVQAKTLELEAA